jgi:hypothetical protein
MPTPEPRDPSLNPGCSETERWVWEEVCAGRVADLDARCGVRLDPRDSVDNRWLDERRRIGAGFIERVLTQDPWRGALPHQGLRIVGARVAEPLDLFSARVAPVFWLVRSRVESRVDFNQARFESSVYLDATVFEAGINADKLQVGGDLCLRRHAMVRNEPLLMGRANITGHLAMDGSAFTAGVDLGGLSCHSLALNDSTFVEGDDKSARRPVRIMFARIEGNLDLSGAELPGLELFGAAIGGDLRLVTTEYPALPRWGNRARLGLRNVRAGGLRDNHDAWPPVLGLLGFVYDRLSGRGRGEDAIRDRPVSWFVDWLARDRDFSRQPYQQLAAVFSAAGYPDRAAAVLYAARERERKEAWKRGRRIEAAGLWLLKITIGYGLGTRMFRVLYWVAGLTLLGASVLWFYTPEAHSRGPVWCLWASLGHLLPVVQLNKEVADFFDGAKGPIKGGWQYHFFIMQSLLGFLLGSFVVAGVSGLTQARK